MTPLPEEGTNSSLEERMLVVGLVSAVLRKDREGFDHLLGFASTGTLKAMSGLLAMLLIGREGGTQEAEQWLRVLALSLAGAEKM